MNSAADALAGAALLLAVAAAVLISALVTWTSRPLLQRYALARPNARSSHRVPTPQGAGIAVIAATLIVASLWGVSANVAIPPALVAATIVIALVGFVDDIVSLPVLVRLVLQAACVGAVVFTAPDTARIVPALPLALERGLIVLAGVWFVNLVNFMDGLDLMTVAEVVPVTAALLLLGMLGDLPWPAVLIATALCGAMLGFAPFNRPVAKVFLGDVGSLPIGLLLGWCLLELALHGQAAAALLLPAYYLADATITLFRRIARREPFWSAHRSHFYQRATDNGFSVSRVSGEVFLLNLVLAGLAILAVRAATVAVTLPALIAGAIAVALLLRRFSRPQAS
ncbi:glycosyltransferase family 4 protein [Bradyrhizobium yuanmingense]|uniref:UDP-N-acetylmuramyl pentapeptide phosphotransferase/UDP-N-acetylglucosamine-1-phosphate transferase n=1 Tax=Bradyrhizobium yuanmingense TaxID=108015 RepID=A0A1C3XDQ2_9BRAD|nr:MULTISPECIES: glycosyltransferase family 4 protein [Bradyrhizobium]MCA1477406.1 glycosyltransferase family 4 protein [Bradyrhizobium sp. NBAIM08]TWI20130.1 UDP-N-acetylmuramyl pentapeptide phosphotransferase/UDP-N-acetylglucosamine-1-phosphate transferase [Bradyrhizobium yuanmingense]UWU82516.1 glycosyltransferase family 4 protein [Bradyrhizobium sp. CB1024]SCB50368.1 UDP-N-acetylmuramyl pentapeptide phosphotransferase/UDP-N-acetylglucosamine-1-phosphate transferase [Bradyrhizobium yuanminge